MMIVVTIGLLIGAALGARFKVLVLVPAFGLGLAAILTIGLIDDTSVLSISVAGLLFLTCLQIGYIGGGFIRTSFARARLSSLQAAGSHRASSSHRPFIVATTASTSTPTTSGADNLM